MKLRTIFHLLITSACLGILLWLIEMRDRENQIAHLATETVFPDFAPAGIERLRLVRPEWEIEIERHPRGWRIVSPFSERADSETVHRILDLFARLPIREQLAPDQWSERGLSPRHFGLENPRTTLTLTGGTREFELWIGTESPMDQGLYVRDASRQTILLTDRSIAGLLPASIDDFRERSFLMWAPADMTRLDIKPYGGAYIQIVRESDGRWMIRQPVTAYTEQGAISKKLDRLFDARVRGFLPVATGTLPAAYGLEDGEAVIQLTLWETGAETGANIFFGHPTPDDPEFVYARRDDSDGVFTVPRDIRDAFLATPGDLRDKRVFNIEPWTVTGMELRKGENAVLLQLRDTGWHVANPVQWKADDETALDTASRICELRASGFIAPAESGDLAKLGLLPERHSLTLWQAGETGTNSVNGMPPAARLLIGIPTPDNTGYYAKREGDTAVFTVSTDQLDGQLIGTNIAGVAYTDPMRYHDRGVIKIDPATVWRIGLQRGESQQIIEKLPDGVWQVVQPANHAVDTAQVQNVLEQLSQIRALRVEHRGIEHPASFGFDRPGMVLTLSLTGTDSISKTLISGFRSRTDGIFLRVQGRDLVFAVARETIDRLSRDLALPPANGL